MGGSIGFENNNIFTTADYYAAGSITGSGLEEITNTDSVGVVSAGTVSGAYTVSSTASTLAVQAPGAETITGSSTTGVAIFGSNSSVNYTVVNPASGSIFAAGGADEITLLSSAVPNVSNPLKTVSSPNAETVYAAGQDTINLYGQGNDFVSLTGASSVRVDIQDANATVVASGTVATNVYWSGPAAGGSLDFINNSTDTAFIQVPVFPVTVNGVRQYVSAENHVTAFGGAGGGEFIGGQGGNNSLIGGSGVVSLIGGGQGDFLQAQGSVGAGNVNDFMAGSGSETMIATAGTYNNLFGAGVNYPGLGAPAANGLISTDGAGAQNYFLGNAGVVTIDASTVSTATNTFYVVSNSSVGGGTFDIYNFSGNSTINLTNNNSFGASTASISGIKADPFNANNSIIGLSDGTRIELFGVSASSLTTVSGGTTGMTKIF
ncbi:MAG: hypothetical protein B7Z81_06325 [Acidocella sp. 20-61-6]|nr:MAG: hypothetical protein B7Z81_06325 [Acidocella sp. 20-61-6]